MRLPLLRPIAIGIAALLPAAAFAHAFLDKASPPVGGTVAAPPSQIRLFFSEPIEPRFSSIALSTGDGHAIPAGPAALDPGDPTQFVLPVPRLAPGRYKVTWRVVSVDTHPTEGDFTFEIK